MLELLKRLLARVDPLGRIKNQHERPNDPGDEHQSFADDGWQLPNPPRDAPCAAQPRQAQNDPEKRGRHGDVGPTPGLPRADAPVDDGLDSLAPDFLLATLGCLHGYNLRARGVQGVSVRPGFITFETSNPVISNLVDRPWHSLGQCRSPRAAIAND